jgi:hypothetical protein
LQEIEITLLILHAKFPLRVRVAQAELIGDYKSR